MDAIAGIFHSMSDHWIVFYDMSNSINVYWQIKSYCSIKLRRSASKSCLSCSVTRTLWNYMRTRHSFTASLPWKYKMQIMGASSRCFAFSTKYKPRGWLHGDFVQRRTSSRFSHIRNKLTWGCGRGIFRAYYGLLSTLFSVKAPIGWVLEVARRKRNPEEV